MSERGDQKDVVEVGGEHLVVEPAAAIGLAAHEGRGPRQDRAESGGGPIGERLQGKPVADRWEVGRPRGGPAKAALDEDVGRAGRGHRVRDIALLRHDAARDEAGSGMHREAGLALGGPAEGSDRLHQPTRLSLPVRLA